MFNDQNVPKIGTNYFAVPFDSTQNAVVLLSIIWSVLTTVLWIWTPLYYLLAGVAAFSIVALVAGPVFLIRTRFKKVRLSKLRQAQLDQLRREGQKS